MMIKSLVTILVIGGASIYNSDLESESAIFSTVLPIVSVISLIGLTLWVVTYFHKKGISQSSSRGGSGIDFFSDGSGGDGGNMENPGQRSIVSNINTLIV